MAHPSEVAAAAIVFVVASIAFVLTLIALRARQRTASRGLLFVTLAFGLFAVKGILVGIALLTEFLEHQHLEVMSALFDLAIVGLLVWPVIR